nr:serine/threonine phosphatase [Petrachloros mirabilis]
MDLFPSANNSPSDSDPDSGWLEPAFDFDDFDDAEVDNIPTLILPNHLVRLEAAGLTDPGRERSQNEDFFVLKTHLSETTTPQNQSLQARGLYILCDGIGGHAEGEVASSLAAETLAAYFREHWQAELPSETEVLSAIYAANAALYTLNEAQIRQGQQRMGTTVVLALIQDTQLRIAHVGDSRLYRYTASHGLEQLTRDHEIGQRDIQRGMTPTLAYARPNAYQLTQALGPRHEQDLKPEVQTLLVTEDTLLLMGSDGLTDYQFLETQAQDTIKTLLNFDTDLQAGLKGLLTAADQYNGHDNITAIAIRVKVQAPSRSDHF